MPENNDDISRENDTTAADATELNAKEALRLRILALLIRSEKYETKTPNHYQHVISSAETRKLTVQDEQKRRSGQSTNIDPELIAEFRGIFADLNKSSNDQQNLIKRYFNYLCNYILNLLLQNGELLESLQSYYALTIEYYSSVALLYQLVERTLKDYLIPTIKEALSTDEQIAYDDIFENLSGIQTPISIPTTSYMRIKVFFEKLKEAINAIGTESSADIQKYSQLLVNLEQAVNSNSTQTVVSDKNSLIRQFETTSGLHFVTRAAAATANHGIIPQYEQWMNQDLSHMYERLNPGSELNSTSEKLRKFLISSTTKAILNVTDIGPGEEPLHPVDREPLEELELEPKPFTITNEPLINDPTHKRKLKESPANRARTQRLRSQPTANPLITVTTSDTQYDYLARAALGIVGLVLLGAVAAVVIAVTHGGALATLPALKPIAAAMIGTIGSNITAAAAIAGATAAGTAAVGVAGTAMIMEAAEPGIVKRFFNRISSALGFGKNVTPKTTTDETSAATVTTTQTLPPTATQPEQQAASTAPAPVESEAKQSSTATMFASSALGSPGDSAGAAAADSRPPRIKFSEETTVYSGNKLDPHKTITEQLKTLERKKPPKSNLNKTNMPSEKEIAEIIQRSQEDRANSETSPHAQKAKQAAEQESINFRLTNPPIRHRTK